MMTAWPSQGTASSSTTPLFMMIPYPSSSPKPINITRTGDSNDIIGTIVGGTAVGAIGIGSAYMLFKYLRPKKRQQKQNQIQEQQEQEEQQEATTIKIGLPDNVAHICVSSAELEEIKQILMTHRKPFRVINVT
jgi:H+/gluconate symporter-like permease